ncbi:MAG: hypothetical protein ACOY90_06800 [Candidatus Zhuqueibacterota bacterium]
MRKKVIRLSVSIVGIIAFIAWSIIPQAITLRQQKQEVLQLEEQITDKFQELKALEQVRMKVNKTADLKRTSQDDIASLEKILTTKENFPDIKFESVQIFEPGNGNNVVTKKYPIKMKMKAQFSKIGEYLVYLESSFSAIQIDKLDVFPVVEDKNLICANLSGWVSF